MYCKYRIVESIGISVSQYKSYRDQVYRYTPTHDIQQQPYFYDSLIGWPMTFNSYGSSLLAEILPRYFEIWHFEMFEFGISEIRYLESKLNQRMLG